MLAVFLATVVAVLVGSHYYIWMRLVRDPQLPGGWGAVATVALALLALAVPLGFTLARVLGPQRGRFPALVAGVWTGLFFLLLVALVFTGLGQWLVAVLARLWGVGADAGFSGAWMGSGLVLARWRAVVVVASAVGLSGVALWNARLPPQITRVAVSLAKLPKALHGFRIVQISDLHVSATLGLSYVAEVVAKTNDLRADLVVITGDLVDGTVDQLRTQLQPLAGLKARYGVYFVTGNHEFYSGADAWCEFLPQLGITPLRHQRVLIGAAADQSFELAGIDDRAARRFGGGERTHLEGLITGTDPQREIVLLAHSPKTIWEAAEHRVGLVLAGHTHGGQIWPFGYLVRLVEPSVAGLTRLNATQMYVSRGTGYWGPPMRLGVLAEITLIELQSPERLSSQSAPL